MSNPFSDTSQLPPTWLHLLPSCTSTNTWALEHIHQLHPGDVVFTRQQTAGRGQQGRHWYAPDGVLTASFICPPLPSQQLPRWSLAAALAVIYAVADLCPDLDASLQLKWMNDIWCCGQKLAGILTEVAPNPEQPLLVVGVGLNRQVDFTQIVFSQAEFATTPLDPNLDPNRQDFIPLKQPISLAQVTETVPSESDLLLGLRQYLQQAASLLCYHPQGFTSLLPALRQRDGLQGRQITLALGDQSLQGKAAGLDDQGRLRLRLDAQTCLAFDQGRVVAWE